MATDLRPRAAIRIIAKYYEGQKEALDVLSPEEWR